MNGDELLHSAEKLREGEAQAILERIGPHLPALTRLSVSLLRNRADAEDVVQETVLRAFQHIHQLREGQCIKGWLMQIAVNEARMTLRTRRRFWDVSESSSGNAGDEDDPPSSFFQRIPDTRDAPDTLVQRAQQGRAIRRALIRLPLKYREVFVLRDMLGVAGAHAASILGISEATLHTRLNRARGQMRKMLAPHVYAGRAKWRPFQMMRDMLRMRQMKVVSCRKVKHEMGKYLDGELYGELLHEVEDHVKVCSRCFLILDTTRKTLQLVADEAMLDQAFVCRPDWQLVVSKFTHASS